MLGKVSYTGLYLDKNSSDILKRLTVNILKRLSVASNKKTIDKYCHHMMITIGSLDDSNHYDKFVIGDRYPISVTHFNYDDKLGVLSFKVKTTVASNNKVKHIVAYIDDNSKYFYCKKVIKWTKLSKWLNLSGTIEQFSVNSKKPLPVKKVLNLFESKLFGEDLSLIKTDIALVVKDNKVIGYGYNILEVLSEMKILKKKNYLNLDNLKVILKKYNLELLIVDTKLFKSIESNDFAINHSYVNLTEDAEFFDLFDNTKKIDVDIFKRNILLADSNNTGRGTNLDNYSVTELTKKLSQSGVDKNTSLIVARDMQKYGVKKGLKNAFSKGLILNIYNIEESFEDRVEGDYYVNDFLFATYITLL